MMRLCKNCGLLKDEENDFYSGKLYPSTRCKECEKERARKTAKKRHEDPVKGPSIRKRRKERESLEEVRRKTRERDRLRHQRDYSKRRSLQAKYFQKNKDKIYNRVNNRFAENPELRLRRSVSSGVRSAIQASGGSKRGRSVIKYLPYTMKELRSHLESLWEPWMNWDNWGVYDPESRTWQIDHIIPQAALPYDDFSHPNFLKCWALSNLRPLESSENLRKGASIDS